MSTQLTPEDLQLEAQLQRAKEDREFLLRCACEAHWRDLVAPWEEGPPLSTHILNHEHAKSFRSAARRLEMAKSPTLRDLRHTYATLSLALGGDLRATQAALGHSELQSTQRYLSSTPMRTVAAGLVVTQAVLG